MTRRPHGYLLVVLAGALLGAYFARASTRDFAQHLDRNVHSLSCSFVPGLAKAEIGPSGCQTTMMSEYSSVFRESVWGGLPISLPAMSVFAFLIFFVVEISLSRRQYDVRATGLLALATLVPALTSLVMAVISLGTLDAVCKLCMGIYAASALALAGGVLTWRRARADQLAARLGGEEPVLLTQRKAPGGDPAWLGKGGGAVAIEQAPAVHQSASRSSSMTYLAIVSGLGVLLVAVPSLAYTVSAPDHSRYIGECGGLAEAGDEHGIFVPFYSRAGGVKAIEVLDPLCPACRAFEKRLRAAGLDAELQRRAVLFPLDESCNWMVDGSTHPGACTVSEAVLCAGDRAEAVVEWAFDNQEDIMAATRADPTAALALVTARFPELARCIGTAESKARLNKSLRWAVKNRLEVLTPQLYIDGVKLCPEDVDLGLDFALTRMIDRARSGTLAGKEGAR